MDRITAQWIVSSIAHGLLPLIQKVWSLDVALQPINNPFDLIRELLQVFDVYC